MGAGGIIQQRVRVLLTAVREPCVWDSLHSWCKERVEEIEAKPELDRNQWDVTKLAGFIVMTVGY